METEALNKLKSKIELLDNKLCALFDSKKNIEAELQNKNKEVEGLYKEFGKELSDFPLDLNKRISEAKKIKRSLEDSLFKIDKKLYGIVGKKPVGLIWKQEKLYKQYKKKAVGNDKLYNELNEESTNKNLQDLSNKIIVKLKQNGLFLYDEMKLIDLCLKVIETVFFLHEKFYYEKDRDDIYNMAIEQVVSNQSKGIGKYIFDYDIETTKKLLNEQTSNTEKLQIINRQLAATKTMLELIEETPTAKAYGDGFWGIYTRDETLSRLIEHLAEQRRQIFNQKITNDVLQEILNGLKDRLKEYYIFLKNEYEFVSKAIEISKSQNKEVTADKELNQRDEKSVEENKSQNITDRDLIREYFKQEKIGKSELEELNQDSSLAKIICENVFPKITNAVEKKAKI